MSLDSHLQISYLPSCILLLCVENDLPWPLSVWWLIYALWIQRVVFFFVSSLLAEIYLARILPQKSFIGVMVLSFERRDFSPAGRINALSICFAFTEAKYRRNTNYFFSLFVEWSPEIEISLLAYAVRLFDQDWRDSLLVQAAPRGVQPSCFFPHTLPHADVPVLTVIH